MINPLFLMEDIMEKYIKNCSIALCIMVVIFYLNMFGAANAEVLQLPDFMLQIMVIGANAFLFLIPVLFLVIFGFGMAGIFKRTLNNQNRSIKRPMEKFPTVWFIVAIACFILYYTFVSAILAS